MLARHVSIALLGVTLAGGARAAEPGAAPAPTDSVTHVPTRPAAPAVDHRVWLGVGLSGSFGALDAAEAPGGGGGAGVEAGARVGKEARRSVALVARVRESVLTGPVRSIGNVEVQVQYPAGTGPFALVGFTHNHEALAADWLADPVGVSAGVAETLRHRTGFELGAGWQLPPPYRETALLARFRPTFDVTAHVFPDDKGPRVYVIAGVGLRFGVDTPPASTAARAAPPSTAGRTRPDATVASATAAP